MNTKNDHNHITYIYSRTHCTYSLDYIEYDDRVPSFTMFVISDIGIASKCALRLVSNI